MIGSGAPRAVPLAGKPDRFQIFRATQAMCDVAAERRRQVSGEGRTLEHDDAYVAGELAKAGASYAVADLYGVGGKSLFDTPPFFWPWSPEFWKPKARRANLVRAAALLIAEIERLDRAVTP